MRRPIRDTGRMRGGVVRAHHGDQRRGAGLVTAFLDDPETGCVTGPIVAAELATQSQIWIEELTNRHDDPAPLKRSAGVGGAPASF